MIHPVAVFAKAVAAGLSTLGFFTFIQAASGEDLGIALEHSAGAGAFATIAVWLVLKGRVDGHSQRLDKLDDGQEAISKNLDKVGRRMAFLAGRAGFHEPPQDE